MARRPTRLLVATRHNPFPENDGAGAYLFDLLRHLAGHGFEIEVAWLHAEGSLTRRGHYQVPAHFTRVARLQIIGGHTLGNRIFFPRVLWLPFKARLLHRTKTILKSLKLGALLPRRDFPSPAPGNSAAAPAWSALPSAEETVFFRQRLRAFRPDALLLNYCWLAPLLDGLAGLPTAILTNDVVSQRLERTPGLAMDPATSEGEAALLARARHILAISEEDAAAFRTVLPDHSILLTPKAAAPRPLGPATDPSRVLFVGGINSFNQEGLQWFLDEVWPLVRRTQPNAHLHICGGICTTLTAVPDGVVLRGRVPDLTTEYAAAAAVIVPLLHGSGVKIKLVDAASHGKAIVTTPVGLQGLGFLRDSVLEATRAAAFADALLRLLADPALQNRLGSATLAAVSRHLSTDIAYGPVCTALASAD